VSTLSFLRLRQGFSLMLTRSALWTVEPATALAGLADDRGQALALYPLDPATQGGFVGVNRHGVALACLEQGPGADALQTLSGYRFLPLALAAAGAGAALERVAAQDLSATAPFILFGADEQGEPLSLRWDGRALQRRLHPDGALQLTTRRTGAEEAGKVRARSFDRLLQGLESLEDAAILAAQQAHHLSTAPQPELAMWASSVPAPSRCLSHALVLPERVILRHWLREDLEAGKEALQQSLSRFL
jgi:hypothetical protein